MGYVRVLLAVSGAVLALGAAAEPAAAAQPESVCFAPSERRAHERTLRLPAPVANVLLRLTRSYAGPCATYGDEVALGDGSVTAYAQVGGVVPRALGVTFPRSTLRDLPAAPTDGEHCYDVDGNGAIDEHMECVGGHEHVLFLPREVRRAVDTPFQWVLFNWNPSGHVPMHVYTTPHFDAHFYIMDLADRNAIGAGPCGILAACDDFARGSVPVPEEYLPRDYADLGAVEAGMGNHLIDLTSPEFNDRPFTHTFIYGAFDGRITFYEPMFTRAWLDGLHDRTIADGCSALKLPRAWERAGWYPTSYCIRYRANRDDYTVSLERFVYRARA